MPLLGLEGARHLASSGLRKAFHRLAGLLQAHGLAAPPMQAGFKATLRPYQEDGLAWLNFCARTASAACSPTTWASARRCRRSPSWRSRRGGRADRSEPDRRAHPPGGQLARSAALRAAARVSSARPGSGRGSPSRCRTRGGDHHLRAAPPRPGRSAPPDCTSPIIDEAQTSRTRSPPPARAARARCQAPLCLTGTPVENHLGDLWSLFDFLYPGLLGTAGSSRGTRGADRAGRTTSVRRLCSRIAPLCSGAPRRRSRRSCRRRPRSSTSRADGDSATSTRRIRIRCSDEVRRAVPNGLRQEPHHRSRCALKLRQVCCDPALVSLARREGGSGKLGALMECWRSCRARAARCCCSPSSPACWR